MAPTGILAWKNHEIRFALGGVLCRVAGRVLVLTEVLRKVNWSQLILLHSHWNHC